MGEARPRAVLVGVKLPSGSARGPLGSVEHEGTTPGSLVELERLVATLGYDVVATVTQARDSLAPAAVIGEGKLKELAALTGGTGDTRPVLPKAKRKVADETKEKAEADESEAEGDPGEKVALIAVDHDITPSQARNLERASGVRVLDRTGVIIEIFSRHARSREARLQVEIAQLAYTAPRVRESPKGKERQRGRGAGEAAIELDRRKIRDRIAELKEELAAIQKLGDARRENRREARRVALVGYTNAGKSSLMRALTASDVTVEDKLFATLDTTVRALVPAARPRVLVSDTVGFIRKLPHDLVASFRSTLDEALSASLLLYIVDAADPAWESQLEVTRGVLADIGAKAPAFVVMNKIDRLDADALAALRRRMPDAWFTSARSREDVLRVRDGIVAAFEATFVSAEVAVPYAKQGLVAEIHELGLVDEERYEDAGVVVRFRTDPESLARLQKKLR